VKRALAILGLTAALGAGCESIDDFSIFSVLYPDLAESTSDGPTPAPADMAAPSTDQSTDH
jgi:hypothetical protein